MFRKLAIVGIASAITLVAGCTVISPSDGRQEGQKDPETHGEAEISEPEVDYSELAVEMRSWEDLCSIVKPQLIADEFQIEKEEVRSIQDDEMLECLVDLNLGRISGRAVRADLTVWVTVLDSNVEELGISHGR